MAMTTQNDPRKQREEEERKRREEEQRKRNPQSQQYRPPPPPTMSPRPGQQPPPDQRGTLPSATPANSEQLQKAEKGEASGGKSPLQFDPNAPAVDTVAQRDQMQVEGDVDWEKPTAEQIHSSQVPVPRDPDKAWQDYGTQAINGLYPHMRNGVDYAWGRKTYDGDAELLAWGENFAEPDMAAIEEAARKLAMSDPYVTYQPMAPLHGGSQLGQGETPATSDDLLRDPRTAGMSPTAGQPTDPNLRREVGTERPPADEEARKRENVGQGQLQGQREDEQSPDNERR
jgi:hypothetical protein